MQDRMPEGMRDRMPEGMRDRMPMRKETAGCRREENTDGQMSELRGQRPL